MNHQRKHRGCTGSVDHEGKSTMEGSRSGFNVTTTSFLLKTKHTDIRCVTDAPAALCVMGERRDRKRKNKYWSTTRKGGASMATFLREMAALVRQNNADALAQRLALSSSDTSKRQFVDS